MSAARVRHVASLAAAAAIGATVALMPGTAEAGFFEQMFGLEPAPQPQAPAAVPQYDFAPRRVHRAPARKRVAVAAIGSGKQTPTDLMHDKTLRRGDAVMMKDGLHVYAGGSGGTHESDEFVPLDRSSLPSKERQTLAAVDTTRASVTEADAGAAGTLASGRSAAVSAPVNAGTTVTDVRGNRVRYVGP